MSPRTHVVCSTAFECKDISLLAGSYLERLAEIR